jgi:outer membrane protein OmpA-like peptidoglycan-associated protein
MSDSLLDGLKSIMTPDLLGKLAAELNEPESAVSKSMGAILPVLVGSTASRADDKDFASTLYNLVTDPGNDADLADNPSRLLGSAAVSLPAMALGAKLLSGLFGKNIDRLAGTLGGYGGVKTGSVSPLFKFASPLLLALLAKFTKKRGLGAAALAKFLFDQRGVFAKEVPGPIGNLESYLAGPARDLRDSYAPPPPPEKKSIWRWLLPLLLAIGAFLLLSRCTGPDETAVDMTPATTTHSVEATAPTTVQALPTAVLYFDVDENDVPTNAQAELADVVAYLKAHPSAKAYVQGYHDPTGDRAHNEELAKQRAQAVRTELMKAGIGTDGIVLDKPLVTTGTGSLAEARRVEVTVKD